MATDISTEQTATFDRTSGGDDRTPDTAITSASATRPSRFAARTAAYGSSIWTDIFNLFKRHTDPIYFGDGSPAKEAIPLDLLQAGSRHSWEHAIDVLGYGDQQGFPPLRELIAQHMCGLGADVSPDTVLVTAGSTQAIDLTSKILLDPGDVVIVEEPTFLGALETFETYEARLVGVPVDEHGMDMDALEAVLAAEPRAKFIYTIPTFQNPTGTTMSIERRHRLIQLARAHGVEILEDDPYVDLRYEGETVPPLRALDDRVIYLGTFSKTIAPGVRTGWVTAPPDIFRLLLAAREISDISNDRIAQRTVYHAAANGLDERVARARDIYRSRRDAMLAALDEFMPEGVSWSRPDGGFFVWITLPATFDVNTFAMHAADFGTVVFPGDWFFHARDVTNTIRLSFSTVPEDRIREGVRRLADAIRAEQASS
ncbi:MAG: PLP-dependent aminotransferase family protein [Thermomicrobiales bacterium]